MSTNHEFMVPEAILGLSPMIAACAVLLIVYFFIITEKIHQTIIAMLGAVAMIYLGLLNQELAVQGIDFNTIFLLIGMMVLVGIMQRSGFFQYVAIVSAGGNCAAGDVTQIVVRVTDLWRVG